MIDGSGAANFARTAVRLLSFAAACLVGSVPAAAAAPATTPGAAASSAQPSTKVRITARPIDRGPDHRAATLEIDAFVPIADDSAWASALPILETRPRGDVPARRICGAASTTWLESNGAPWSNSREGDARVLRLRFAFDGDSIAAADQDGPWRLRFVLLPDDRLVRSNWRHFEAVTPRLQARDFGRNWIYGSELEAAWVDSSTVRLSFTVRAVRPDTARFLLSAWSKGGFLPYANDHIDVDDIEAVERAALLEQIPGLALAKTVGPPGPQWAAREIPERGWIHVFIASSRSERWLPKGTHRVRFDLTISGWPGHHWFELGMVQVSEGTEQHLLIERRHLDE